MDAATAWRQICDMAYFRSHIVDEIIVGEHNNITEKARLDYHWKQYSSLKDPRGDFIEALVVPELKYIRVPYNLFHTEGVYAWFRHSFPNCVITFWEE